MNFVVVFLRVYPMKRKRVGDSFLFVGEDVRLNFNVLFSMHVCLLFAVLKRRRVASSFLAVAEDVLIVFSNFNLCFQRFSNLFSSLFTP